MKNSALLIFAIVCLSINSKLKSQEEFGGKVGLSIQFGTHIQRLGLMYQIYFFNQYGQVNQGAYVHFNFKNLGPPGSYFEMKLLLGLQGHWASTESKKYLFNELVDMSPYRNSIGYSIYWYLDKHEMSQTTGTVHFSIDDFSMAVENDAFGTNPYDDKFRTGAFLISYQSDSILYSLQSTLWTGLSFDAPKFKDDQYPAKKGYRDPSDVKYGKYSHGILAMRVDYAFEYNQVARAEMGIDAERVRNFFQNRVIHNALPDRWVGYENPHYPMLQDDGTPYLYRENQKIKKVKPYFQLSGNQSALY